MQGNKETMESCPNLAQVFCSYWRQQKDLGTAVIGLTGCVVTESPSTLCFPFVFSIFTLTGLKVENLK
jgi:hypothetical protein